MIPGLFCILHKYGSAVLKVENQRIELPWPDKRQLSFYAPIVAPSPGARIDFLAGLGKCLPIEQYRARFPGNRHASWSDVI